MGLEITTWQVSTDHKSDVLPTAPRRLLTRDYRMIPTICPRFSGSRVAACLTVSIISNISRQQLIICSWYSCIYKTKHCQRVKHRDGHTEMVTNKYSGVCLHAKFLIFLRNLIIFINQNLRSRKKRKKEAVSFAYTFSAINIFHVEAVRCW